MNATELKEKGHKTEKEIVNAAIDKIYKMEKKVGQKIGEYTDEMKEVLADAPDNLARYVKKHPLKSVGISVVCGVVAARMLSRLFRD